MAIDIKTEELLSLTHAAGKLHIRRDGKKPHVATLYRWATVGLRDVVLETVQVGGTRCTSMGALQRFFDRLAGEHSARASSTSLLKPDVEAALDRAGL